MTKRQAIARARVITGIAIFALMSLALWVSGAEAAGVTTRVKDIARLQGVRANQLSGMGMVVGLNGTGDSSRANIQMVTGVLTKMGYNNS
ncbi:MAG TPA: flagellar basal body P-ring protein FlgI, partial [Bacillota bacterium]